MCKSFLHATCNQYNWFSIGWPWGFRHNSMAAQNSMNRKVLDLKAGISKHTAEQVLGSGLKKKGYSLSEEAPLCSLKVGIM